MLGFGQTIFTCWHVLPAILIITLLVKLRWWMMPQRTGQMRKVDRDEAARERPSDSQRIFARTLAPKMVAWMVSLIQPHPG